MEETTTNEPKLYPIHNKRWAASGDGWAVHGDTQEEAIANYWKAYQRRQEILAMPTWRQQIAAKSHAHEYF